MFDRHEYEVLEADAFFKGEACGVEKGFEKGVQQEREKNDAQKLKMAEYFRSKGIPEEIISEGLALK